MNIRTSAIPVVVIGQIHHPEAEPEQAENSQSNDPVIHDGYKTVVG
jgi:hypothetical protein